MNKKCLVGMVIIVVFIMMTTPIIIHVSSSGISSEISADGLLDYLGNCIAAIPTIVLALVAIWQTNKSNDISKKLLELEENRQNLDMRPSFVVTQWRAPIKNFNSICINPECLSIQVGEYSNEEAWGIELELFNTSSGFESICFNEAHSLDGKYKWINSMAGASTRKLELPSLEKTKVYFYADKTFWKKQEGAKFVIDFFVRNRIDIPYREKFEFMIMSMTDTVNHKDGEVYLYLEIQNYSVGKIVEKSKQNLEGVDWDK